MPLSPGMTLGCFEILAPLGAGGMGEVYRARDTRLQRDVALKLLPETFASDPDRIGRFEREAHTLAALNHPHIAQVYGFERGESSQALVMELVEGDDLSQLIARGRLPLDDALPIARQIADALEAAHDAGSEYDDASDRFPSFLSDGKHFLYTSTVGSCCPAQKAISETTKEETVFTQEGPSRRGLYVTDISPDGTLILFQRTPPDPRQTDLWMLRKRDKTPAPYLQTNAVENDATFSPDGKWIAYHSAYKSGQRPQVYVQPYPATGGLFQMSWRHGFQPLWRSDGKELFFLTEEGMMAVTIDTTNGFRAGSPQPLIPVTEYGRGSSSGRNTA